MHLLERVWAGVISFIGIVTLSPVPNLEAQSPLQVPSNADIETAKGPRFYPPGGVDDGFECQYPQMVGWEMCSTPTDRKCWLRRKTDHSQRYDVYTNYEDERPIGVTRYYELELDDGAYDADGENFDAAKLFNNQYPGPWIQACWGDT